MNRGGTFLTRAISRTSLITAPHHCPFHRNTRLSSSSASTLPSATPASAATVSTSKSKYLARTNKRLSRITTKEPNSSISPSAGTLVTHLTDLPGKQHKTIFQGADGEQRLARFIRLHAALQNPKDLEPLWDAYQEIRKYKQDMDLLSSEVFRLLVIHFKNSSSAYKSFNWDKRAWEQKWASRIVTVLVDKRKCRPKPSRWDSSDLMSALNRLQRFEESLQEMNRLLSGSQGIDPILLSHAVRAWGGLGRLDKAMESIEDAKARFNIKPSEFTLGYLIQQFLLVGNKPIAIGLWRELRESPMEDIQTANGLLRACVKVRDSNFAQTVYDSLGLSGIEATVDTLNMMLQLAVSELQFTDDRAKFLETINNKIAKSDRPIFDKSMLDSILVGFSKKGDIEGAILVNQLMRKHGFSPNTQEHNVILHGYVKLDKVDKAIDWFHQMRREGISPDRTSYLLLIEAYTQKRMPRESEALFRQLILDGIDPDLAVCNSLLLAYEQGRMNRRCLQLYRNMFRDRVGLDGFSFSCMFNAVFHNDKAILEGGEGLHGQGSILDNPGFIRKIGEPIGKDHSEQRFITLDNDSSNILAKTDTQHNLQSNPSVNRQKFQFDQVASHTVSLEPRTLFRDMVIVGIQPSRTLYGNILRAFLSQNDFAGAAVALRTLLDYYMLKPTPKMNAIVVNWVCQELERRDPGNRESAGTLAELSKLISGLGRTRGLVDILEKVAKNETVQDPTTPDRNEEIEHKDKGRCRNRVGFPENNKDALQVAKMEMGGDIVDLFERGVPSGSSWSRTRNDRVQLDLKDFEHWFKTYSKRRTRLEAESMEPLEPHNTIILRPQHIMAQDLQEEVQGLQAQIDRLQDTIQQLEQRINDLENETRKLKHQNNELEDENRENEDNICKLQCKNQDLKDENSELKYKCRKLGKENYDLEYDNSQLKYKNRELKDKNNELMDENSELESVNSKLEKKNQDLKEENSELMDENSELESVNSKLEKKNQDLEEENIEFEEENMEFEEENMEFEEENRELKRKYREIENENYELEDANSELQNKNYELKDENKELMEEKNEIESENRKLEDRILDLEADI
ncbi:hypothetical protein BGZ81_009353 [Podila clonocystis]|nr:hypothetical protein BGZ81_009353 [Podila clonocystis]